MLEQLLAKFAGPHLQALLATGETVLLFGRVRVVISLDKAGELHVRLE